MPAVAIEAGKRNYDLLLNNARANGDRFRVLHRAVLDVSGKTVRLFGKMHAGLSLKSGWDRKDKGIDAFEEVESISLDDAAARYLPERDRPILI